MMIYRTGVWWQVCLLVNSGNDWVVGCPPLVNTHMEQGGLDHFPQLLNLLLTSTNIAVGHIRLLLYLQHENTVPQLVLETAWSNVAIFHVILVKKRWRLAVVSQKTHCNNVGKIQITPQISWQCCCHNWVDSYLHHGDRWVNLRRQRNVDLILVSVDAGRTKETRNSADCFTRQLT